MAVSTRYSIIGSGNIGTAMARLFARGGIEVSIANTRGTESLRPLVDSLGTQVRAVSLEEALEGDVIVLAIPFAALGTVGAAKPDWTGKTVIDATNAVYSPGSAEILRGRLGSTYVANVFPGADVVKSFNHLPAQVLGTELDPAVGKRVIFVASDSPDASSRVAALIIDLGQAVVELGRIDEGGRLIEAPNSLVLRNLVEPLR
ncbi:MAG: NAD(P)-binding domain-containing protein [Nakamurella sp.]